MMSMGSSYSRISIFSVCRKLCHFPVCRWLLMASAYIKHNANKVTTGKDDETNNISIRSMLTETITKIQQEDPIRGNWCVDEPKFTVWVDASPLATGIVLEANGSVVKGASWLQPVNNVQHINLAELNTVSKGVKLVLQWQAKVLHIKTDSVCVYR